MAKTLGVVDQTLFNWAKAQSQGKHKGANNNPVSAEQMERHPCQGKRRFKVTTDSNHTLAISANLPNRGFSATGPDRVWAGDTTHTATDEG